MSERLFIKSSYSDDVGGACVETSSPEGYTFKKSSYSGFPDNDCIEIGTSAQEADLLIRDSKFETGSPMAAFSPEAFTAFAGHAALLAESYEA